MKLTTNQKQLVALTLELDLKAREYKELCKQYETIKNLQSTNINQLEDIKQKLLKNQQEIKNINIQLNKLQKSDK